MFSARSSIKSWHQNYNAASSSSSFKGTAHEWRALPITINCDFSSDDDENNNNNDGADNEGSEVDKNTHDNYPYMISHSTTLYPCRRREIEIILVVVTAAAAALTLSILRWRRCEEESRRRRMAVGVEDDRSQQSRLTDSEMMWSQTRIV